MGSKKKPNKGKAKKPAAKRASAPAADPNLLTEEEVEKLGTPIQTYTRSLPVNLTPLEYDERGHEAGVLSAQIKALEADKRAKNEAINAEIKKANARLDQVHAQLNTRTEDREVEVSVFADIEKGLKLTVRTDILKIIAKDKMSPAEKRGDVPVAAPPPPASEPSKDEGKKGGRKVKGKKVEVPLPESSDETPPEEAPPSDEPDGNGSDEGDDDHGDDVDPDDE